MISWQRTANTTADENAARVHAPTDIGERSLKTRSMLRNLDRRPRSAINRGEEATAPNSATHNAARTSEGSLPRTCATKAMLAAPPASPPRKKYSGTCQVQTGGFN